MVAPLVLQEMLTSLVPANLPPGGENVGVATRPAKMVNVADATLLSCISLLKAMALIVHELLTPINSNLRVDL